MESSSSAATRKRSGKFVSYDTSTGTKKGRDDDDDVNFLVEHSKYSESSEEDESGDDDDYDDVIFLGVKRKVRESPKDDSVDNYERISEAEFRNKDRHYATPTTTSVERNRKLGNKKRPNSSAVEKTSKPAKFRGFDSFNSAEVRKKKLPNSSAVEKISKPAKFRGFDSSNSAQLRKKKIPNSSAVENTSKPAKFRGFDSSNSAQVRKKKKPNSSAVEKISKPGKFRGFDSFNSAQLRNLKRPNSSAVKKISKPGKFRGFDSFNSAQLRNLKRPNFSEESTVSKAKFRNDKLHAKEFAFEQISEAEFRNKKVETTTSVRQSGFRNCYIKKDDQIRNESKAEFRKRHCRSAQKGRVYQHETNESEDGDEIQIKESSSAARSHRIGKGKQPDAKTDSVGCPSSYTSTKLKSHNRKSDHKGFLRSPRINLRSGVAEKSSEVIEFTSDSSLPSDDELSDSTTSEYDDSDDSPFEVERLEPIEVSSSSAESAEEDDYVSEEKSEDDHHIKESRSETKDLMEFSDSNNDDDQESVLQDIIKKHGLYSSKTSLDASSKVNESKAQTEVREVQENNEREKHMQESVTKRVKGKRKDEDLPVADRKRLKKVVSLTDIRSNEIGKRMEKQREKSVNREKERNLTGKKAKGGTDGKNKVDVEEDSGIMHQSRGSTPIKEHTSRREEVNAEFEETEAQPTKTHGVHVQTDNHLKKAKGGDDGKNKVDVEEDSGTMHQSRGSTPIKDHTSRREEVNVEFEETETQPTKRHGVHVRTDNQLKKSKGGADGKNKVDVEEDSGTMHQSRGSTPMKEHTSRREEVNAEFEETEVQPTKTHGVYVRTNNHFCKNLLDSVLGKNDEGENREEEKESLRLPSKFWFEDEVPKPVEKSEYEIMTDNLFAEMDFCLTLEETGPSGCQEVEEDNVEDSSDDETDHYAMCRKGKHYLIQDEEQGLVCLYCFHIEIAAKDILPSWAVKPYRISKRQRFTKTEQRVEKDGVVFLPGESSKSNYFNYGVNGTTVWDYIEPSTERTLFDHQKEGFEFLWRNIAGTTELSEITSSDSTNGGGCIISHAPGTGKTRLTMVFIEAYLRRFPHCRPLIIAPASMLLTWEEEFKRWEVEFPFLNLNNDEIPDKEYNMALQHIPREKNQKRDAIRTIKIYSWNKGKSILGMSYNLFVMLVGEKNGNKMKRNVVEKEPNHDLRTILLEKPGLVVLDEGHIPRNRGSNIWQAISKLKTEKRIILSGTPFQNNFEELFNVLQVVRPSIVKEKRFNEIFASKRNRKRSQLKPNDNEIDNDIEELKGNMAPFVHVHKGTILQERIPGLIDCVVLLKPLPLQKFLIEKIERSENVFTDDSKVAHISTHPYLFKKCEQITEKERYGVDEAALDTTRFEPNQGVKTRFIMELVRLSVARNEKVLIFSQYLEPLSFVKEHLETTFNWAEAKQILMIKGGVELKHRQNFISSFNDPHSEAKVLLASTRCCSEGINLVGASRVVLLDVVWNPAVENQAIRRAFRLGQTKMVYTYHLMAMGTREQDKFRQQTEKERWFEMVFTSSSNEKCKAKNLDVGGIEDGVLEYMLADVNLKDLFEKVIYQPKEKESDWEN